MLLTKLLGDEDQIQNVDHAIAVGVRGGFTEPVGDLDQIQDVDGSIAVDIGGVFGFEVDFAIEVGEQMGLRRSSASPIGYGGGR